MTDYENSLAVYAEFGFAYKHRGELYQKLGKLNLAKQDWDKAASLFQQQNNTEQYQIVQQLIQKL